VDNTLKGESTEESKEDSKDKMENTWKGQISMDVSDKSGVRRFVVEFKFVTENCAVSNHR